MQITQLQIDDIPKAKGDCGETGMFFLYRCLILLIDDVVFFSSLSHAITTIHKQTQPIIK